MKRRRMEEESLAFDVPAVPAVPTLPALAGRAAPRLRLKGVWSWGTHTACRCPSCGCSPEAPCTITLEDACGSAFCVPAGVYAAACSGCHLG